MKLQTHATMPVFYVDATDPNSGPHACTVDIGLTDPVSLLMHLLITPRGHAS